MRYFIIYLRSSANSALLFVGLLLSIFGEVTVVSRFMDIGEIIDFRWCLRGCFLGRGFSDGSGVS